MNNFINKTNQYLLERYPIIWNTKIVWLLLIAAVIHFLFFVMGYLTLSNPQSLQDYNVSEIFFENGGILISFILSILLIVFWLIMMFKNNAFKSFYPTTVLGLMKQFGAYLIIIFASISFYYSYQAGLKIYIDTTYNDERFEQDIETINRASLFFTHNIYDYKLNSKSYPVAFQDYFCETDRMLIQENQPYLKSTFDSYYQFYSLKTVKRNEYVEEYIDSLYDSSLFIENLEDGYKNYYFKDKVVDVSDHIVTAQPSYHHFSDVFFQKGRPSYYKYEHDYSYDKTKIRLSDLEIRLATQNNQLLENNNPAEIKKLLQDFLTIARSYRIKHNLNTDLWFNLVYHPTNFEVKNLIKSRETDQYYDRIYNENEELSPLQEYAERINTSYYINTEHLKRTLTNIEDIKNDDMVHDSIHVVFWISFCIALVIFSFRLTGLKSVLFTIITAGVLSIIVGLVSVLVLVNMLSGSSEEFFVMYFIFFLGTAILLGTIFYMPQMNKMVASIFLNLTTAVILPYILLVIAIISAHQDDYCEVKYPRYEERNDQCFILIESLGIYWSPVFIGIAIIALWFLSKAALKWKSLPEG
ncbi:hypothetical protein [Nonlabens sp.]|uniref:hypothetical protein n=1 Tax=Nonlabens sp. TaxID=1888209 RepID=UPI003F697CC8